MRNDAYQSAPLRLLFAALGVTAAVGACAGADVPAPASNSKDMSFAVYALSRGKGVPERTRVVLQDARALLEAARKTGKAVRVTQERIGIEGEQRLCAEFKDAAAADEMLARIQQLATGVELLNIVREPCKKR